MSQETGPAPIPLSEAPFNQPLELVMFSCPRLAKQLNKMGLDLHSEIIRLDETLAVQTMRIQTENGPRILSGGMGLKTVVHLDDGRRVPLHDMEAGETGHVEGATGGRDFAKSLSSLDLHENDQITLVRKLPPMEYLVTLNHTKNICLSEGDAARIIGLSNGTKSQFSLAPSRNEFVVAALLGGVKSISRLQKMGIEEGTSLTLNTVRARQTITINGEHQLMINSRDGLHLHLSYSAGKDVFVTVK